VQLCVWGQARARGAERGGNHTVGVGATSKRHGQWHGQQTPAGSAASPNGKPAGGWSAAPRQPGVGGTPPPSVTWRPRVRGTPALLALSTPSGPAITHPSRSARRGRAPGPAHPSWLAPHSSSHSSTKQVCVYLEQPPSRRAVRLGAADDVRPRQERPGTAPRGVMDVPELRCRPLTGTTHTPGPAV
jgi:hypothetical protein